MAKYASLDSLRAIRDWVKEKFQSKLPEISATDNGKVLSVVEGQWEPTELQEELPEVTSADNGKVLAVVAGEWEKAEAPDELPPVQSADNGKVLTVVEGEWAKADVPDELPAVSASDNGKVLGVVEGQWAKTEPEDGLPEVTSSDNGKVLSVVEGAWAPAVPSGGSGLPEVTSEDNGDILSVVNGAWAKSEPEGPGYEVVETVIAPEQSVTTIDNEGFVLGEMTATWHSEYPESIIVTFNGTEYTLPKNTFDWGVGYGELDGNEMPVFTTYPCFIAAGDSTSLNTAEPGTYTVSARSEALVPSDAFREAVNLSYTQATVTQETLWAAQSITTEAVSGKSYAAADGPTFDSGSPVPGKLNVVFDGTAYELPKIPTQRAYGAETYEGDPDFTTYPLFLLVVNYGSYSNLQLRTPQAGTYTLEATYDVSTTAPTEKFKEAVKQSGGGMQTVMFEMYYDDSGEHTPEHLIIECDKTIDELTAADGPLFAQALFFQTNPPVNAIAAMASYEGGNFYAEFQFIQILYESPEELAFVIIRWNGVLQEWTAEWHVFGLTPLT